MNDKKNYSNLCLVTNRRETASAVYEISETAINKAKLDKAKRVSGPLGVALKMLKKSLGDWCGVCEEIIGRLVWSL